MLKKIAIALFLTTSPVALLAQEVELQSADGFISVTGQIVGFNGTMLSVETSVGVVSVPASEVACIGDACLTALADPALGLTEDDFEDVIASATPPAPAPAPVPVVTPRSDTLSISFAQSGFGELFGALANNFASNADDGVTENITAAGAVELANSAQQQNATINVTQGNSNSAIRVVTAPLTGTDTAEYQSPADWSLIGPWTHHMMALRGFAVVVSPDVPVTQMSLADLAGIYAGEIDNWSDLGGPDKRILPLQLPAGSAARDELIALVMEPAGKTIAGNVLTMADERAIAGSVQQFPGSISVVGLENIGDNDVLPVAGSCGKAVTPDPFNLISGDYPLVRPVMAQMNTTPSTSLVTGFFDSAARPAGQATAAALGFVDQTPVTQDAGLNNERLATILGSELGNASRAAAARMFESLFDAERLSPTLISGPLSGVEGAWNRAMFVSLADLLAGDDYTGREVFFVGLAEAESDQAAIDISQRAAAEMQAAFGQFAADVISENDLQLSSFGFGNVAQVTCYDSQISGEVSGQIEIWVR
ncbi:PstS family phosphate ABC transporter substrate-binding protein [Yoonia sp. 2307UL14-13]|uniref:PstS family phosphate ABC transporter substrate-binding protein n=1 Tax=Yoonia sp. 2307UL14-13 TaxID=3126506 RepID=UPI0030AC6435